MLSQQIIGEEFDGVFGAFSCQCLQGVLLMVSKLPCNWSITAFSK